MSDGWARGGRGAVANGSVFADLSRCMLFRTRRRLVFVMGADPSKNQVRA